MKFYVSGTKEIEALKQALRNAKPSDSSMRDVQLRLLERVVICENLQENIKKAEDNK